MVYVYTVRRTQMYLGARETELLDAVARRSGKTRSQLVREAIGATYAPGLRPTDLARAIHASFGAWAGRRAGGARYVERLRRGRLATLHARS